MKIHSKMLKNLSWTGSPIRALPVETPKISFNKPVKNKEKIKEWKSIWVQSDQITLLHLWKEEETNQ